MKLSYILESKLHCDDSILKLTFGDYIRTDQIKRRLVDFLIGQLVIERKVKLLFRSLRSKIKLLDV